MSSTFGAAVAIAHAPEPVATARPPAASSAQAANRLLTPGQALALARATGKTITVGSLTTTSSLTTVNPVGRFTVTESFVPVRAWRGGRWVGLNPVLRRGPGGRLIPAAVASAVSLSAGGSGPLADLSNSGWTMQVEWPGSLPAPTVSGSTATYHNVPVQGADVVVTVSAIGSVAVVAEATNTVAAQALASIKLMTSAPGLSLTADQAGNLAVSEEPGLEPLFTAQAPRTWDSPPLPARTPVTTDPGSGEKLAVPSGLAARSSPSGPGGLARPVAAQVAVAGGTITVTPSAARWTGHATVYPVYTAVTFAPDVTRDAAAWAQISSGASTSWMPTGCLDGHSGPCLQAGFCDSAAPNMGNCGNIGITRTLLRFSLPVLPAGTKVASANVYLENVWTAACTAEPLELWAIPSFSRATTWSSRRSWRSRLEQESFHGYGDVKLPDGGRCGPGYDQRDVIFGTDSGTKKGVRITAGSASALTRLLGQDLAARARSVSLGLRAPDESTGSNTAYLQWRQFMDKARAIILQFSYYHLPSVPSGISSSPGGPCQASRASQAVVGADGLTLYANASDPDGDQDLTTTFAIYAIPGGHREYRVAVHGSGLVPSPYLTNGQVTRWRPHGTTRAYRYYYTARTANSAGSGPTSPKCYFLYNPGAPAAPIVIGYPTRVRLGQFLHGIRFSPGGTSHRGCPRSANCPVSYTYQLGDTVPVTVTRTSPGLGNWNARTGTWTGTLAVPELGPLPLTVTAANKAGNTSPASTPLADSTPPAPLADGYFSDGHDPDLLFTGTGREPSLWLAPGTGNGNVGPPVDIGSLGNVPLGGPADWAGALVLRGELTGHHVQDVMAYWPGRSNNGLPAGTGVVVGGTGDAIALDPDGGNARFVGPDDLCDPHFDNCASVPSDLVAAGDASQQHNPVSDLIGYVCDGNRCELNLYTASTVANYSLARTLSGPSAAGPDGTDDWRDYTLATAQLPDASHPHGDPADTVLLALNRTTGQLYESVNHGCPAACGHGPLIGTAGTWTPIQGIPRGSTPPTLLSADVTDAHGPGTGSPEIWTRLAGASSVTSYAIVPGRSGPSLRTDSTSSIATPADDWPLTGTTSDTITGQSATLHGTRHWSPDPVFTTVLGTNGGYVTPPPGTIPARPAREVSVSVWFRTSDSRGILVSLQARPFAPRATRAAGYAPVLYIGTDGHLRGLWPAGTDRRPLTSPHAVDTGTWEHAVLTAITSAARTTQTLYLNGRQVARITAGPLTLAGLGPKTNLTFAAGYIGGQWPSQPYRRAGHIDYFTGQLANITVVR